LLRTGGEFDIHLAIAFGTCKSWLHDGYDTTTFFASVLLEYGMGTGKGKGDDARMHTHRTAFVAFLGLHILHDLTRGDTRVMG